MVAERDSLEAAFQPVDRLETVWAASDQVADAEEPVAGSVELQLREGAIEGAETTVDVADHEVAAVDVGRERTDAR